LQASVSLNMLDNATVVAGVTIVVAVDDDERLVAAGGVVAVLADAAALRSWRCLFLYFRNFCRLKV